MRESYTGPGIRGVTILKILLLMWAGLLVFGLSVTGLITIINRYAFLLCR